jgi:hypothetical protein
VAQIIRQQGNRTRTASSRNTKRHWVGTVGEIISECLGDFTRNPHPGGAGAVNGYEHITFNDGSELWLKFIGTFKMTILGKIILKRAAIC